MSDLKGCTPDQAAHAVRAQCERNMATLRTLCGVAADVVAREFGGTGGELLADLLRDAARGRNPAPVDIDRAREWHERWA